MNETEIHDYAKRLFNAHGDRAEAEAAHKAREFDGSGNQAQAEDWRRIRAAIASMRGPHAS